MPKLKLNDDGSAVVKDGKILLVHEDGTESPFDLDATHETLASLRGEAGTWRKKLRDAESKVEAYAGIEDPVAARNALQTVASMSDEHKIQVENLKSEMTNAWSEKVKAEQSKVQTLEQQIFKFKVSDKFHSSPIAKKLIYEPEDAAVIFGQNFSLDENGNIVGKLGEKTIYSKINPGEPAGFDEALDAMIQARPNKDNILKGTGMQGSGSPPGPGSPGEGTGTKSNQENIAGGLKERGWT